MSLRDSWIALKIKVSVWWEKFKWRSKWWHRVERVWWWYMSHWEVNPLRTLFLTFVGVWLLGFMCWAVRFHG